MGRVFELRHLQKIFALYALKDYSQITYVEISRRSAYFFVFLSFAKGSSKALQIDSSNNQKLVEAMVAQQSGRYVDAIKIYRAILDSSPRNKDALHHFGMAMYALKRIDEARKLLQASLVVSNDQPDVHMNLARISFNDKSFDETDRHLVEVLRLNPDHAEARILKGRCYAARSLHTEAAEQFLAALENDPDDLDVALRLADSCEKIGKLQDAIMYYEYILQREPSDRKARINYAMLLRRAGQLNEALKQCEEGILRSPEDVEFLHNRAALHEELGDFETAHSEYLGVLAHAPKNGLALGSLVRMRRPRPPQNVVESAIQFVNDEQTELFDKIFVLYSLGSYFDSNHEYESAFRYYSEANRFQASDSSYDARKFEQFIKRLVEDFSPDPPNFLSADDVSSERRPIFILGMPRSGTTLTEQILASHSKVIGCGEIDFFVKSFGFGGGKISMRNVPDSRSTSLKDFLISLRNQYYAHIDNVFGDCRYFTDKMPFNFLYIGLIRAAFPDAKFIHCVRHPIDVCLSCYFQNLTGNHSFSMSLDSAAHYYLQYHKIMGHYKELMGDSLITLRYDSLIDDFETVSKWLVSECGLKWEPACLEFFNTRRAVTTPSNWQVRQPIYRTSLARRMNYAPYLRELSAALVDPVNEYEAGVGIFQT